MAAIPLGFVSRQDANKAIVQASFDRWRSGTGGAFELLAPEAEWTIQQTPDDRNALPGLQRLALGAVRQRIRYRMKLQNGSRGVAGTSRDLAGVRSLGDPEQQADH
jgi:ketosteroid isomerase-like protein